MSTHVLIVDDSMQSRFYMKSALSGQERYEIRQELESAESASFTERELEVIKLKAKGYSYAEIAEKLGITERTVKYHLTQMLNRTGHETPGQLAYELLSKRIILPDF